MPAPHQADALEDLPRTPASDVKKLGWRGVMKVVARQGKVVVTNHNEPEAVILPVAEYHRLMHGANARDEAALDTLRRRFDERLKSLDTPEANDKLRAILRKPLKLDGKVIAGEGF
ncbi:type II toxin-antitoxin system prevent-host-death family antitoxin [Luteimonas terricola]|uniref:Antitoxin n=1 Tax=Luteimonas terricola TaxID=645597 RepID=A0ABQ2EL66_9GAMM|nr:type II toxin-antitoxin system prevent-host-death family antitoxin [Luteimonas terricola]GGK15775.1 hypothetical protein GCM10011394_26170 [Luteimonas terricola]